MEHKEAQILEQFKSYLPEVLDFEGLEFSIESDAKANGFQLDFILFVRLHDFHARLACQILSDQSSANFENKLFVLNSVSAQHADYSPCLVARYLSSERRKRCKEEGLNYFDLSGNAYLKYKSLLVERDGFPSRFPEKRAGRSPFSDKASLILREALKYKDRAWGVRELAEAVKLDPGFVSRMIRELENRRYIGRINSKFKLENPEHILADWVDAYDYRKNEDFKFFCLARNPEEILDKMRKLKIPAGVNYALGFQAAAGLVAPHARYKEVQIYVENKADVDFFRDSLKLEEVEEGANMVISLPYYNHSAFYDKRQVDGLWVVSDLQLYLDLYKYPLRGLEQAEYLFKKRIKPMIEGKINVEAGRR
jgi:hypothetical protein